MRVNLLSLIIILLALPFTSKSQLTELQFFTQKEIEVFNTTQGMWFVETLFPPDTVMSIYKSDFSLYRNIELPQNPFDKYYGVYYLSDKLFNTDIKLEFVMTYKVSSTNSQIGIFNEDGEMLYDFGIYPSAYCKVYERENQKPLLFLVYLNDANDWGTRIYELPGEYLQIAEIDDFNPEFAYPNPTDNIIEIPLLINNQNELEFRIFNASGAMVDHRVLNPNDHKIRLEAGILKPGIYIYSGGGVNGKFIVK